MTDYRYDAFVSYSRAIDGQLAPAVERALKQFAKPVFRRRALEVFRDEASLSANPSLWKSIERALNQSRYFVLLASPESAASKWVTKELSWWLANRSTDQLCLILTDGRLEWSSEIRRFDGKTTTALSNVAMDAISDEPRWVDLTWARKDLDVSMSNARFVESIADIASLIHGRAKDELFGDDVKEHNRLRLLRRSAISLLILLSMAALTGALTAIGQRNQAVNAQKAAELAEAQAQIERENALTATRQEQIARELAEQRREVAFRTLGAAVENLSKLSSDLVDYMSDFPEIPKDARIQTLESTENALWDFANANELEAVRQTMFTNALERISATYYGLGERSKSQRAWERVVALQRQLVEQNPNVLGYKSALAATLVKRSFHKQAAGDALGQLQDLREAVRIFDVLRTLEYAKDSQDDPTIPEDEFKRIVADNYERFRTMLDELEKK